MGIKAEHTETLIVGAGPAGLAVAACLRKLNLPFVLLEKSGKIGSSWHNHYERLHLHTDKNRSELPFMSYPDSFPKYPSRLQFIDYLHRYADLFNLEPRFHQEVESARYKNNRWEIQTKQETYTSENLVIATGYNRRPVIPKWPGSEHFSGTMIHSCDYINGTPYNGKRVLVVGFGNSGGEIAIDLFESGADVSLSVRSPVNIIPRDILGLPILAVAIPLSKLPTRIADLLTAPVQWLKFGNLERLSLERMKYGPFEQMYKKQRIPLIDVGTVDLIRRGCINVYPDIKQFVEDQIHFSDQSTGRFDAVVLATGYRPALNSFLDESLLTNKKPAEGNGLYFCGFFVSPTGVLREIAIEAKEISRKITGIIDFNLSLHHSK